MPWGRSGLKPRIADGFLSVPPSLSWPWVQSNRSHRVMLSWDSTIVYALAGPDGSGFPGGFICS